MRRFCLFASMVGLMFGLGACDGCGNSGSGERGSSASPVRMHDKKPRRIRIHGRAHDDAGVIDPGASDASTD